MKFSMYDSARSQKGYECTYDKYLETASSPALLRLCNDIAAEEDADKRGELKKRLPVITWQAYFPGKRLSKEAQPSGLFMLDMDHVDNPGEVYAKQVVSRVQELGIVYVGMTASRKGLRIVAKCRVGLTSIEECQRWLASNLEVEYDGVCKDWARCSFLVHDSYTYYMNAKAIWEEEPEEGTVYDTHAPVQPNTAMEEAFFNDNFAYEEAENATPSDQPAKVVDQREGLFGGKDDYKGFPLSDIAREWLEYTGGEPEQGERNARLYKLALRMRYICDFNAATMLRVMPRYGLPESEIKQLIQSALSSTRAADMQKDMQDVLKRIDQRAKLTEGEDDLPPIITSTNKVPSLPPLLRQWWEVSPEDFKVAVTLCQLPILGALGSRLRARYLDGQMQSPSFQVSLEAPQASGKSFMGRLVDYELAMMKQHDEEERAREEEYNSKVKEMKLLNVKITPENKADILGTKPTTLVRYVPATMSITKLLMRMQAAQGLHLFAMSPEIDTVYKAFKRGFSSYSDALRCAFDNAEYGQDYASENSFSGVVRLYYNVLFSGTPKAMCRFYPDVEDGLVSRVLFVTLPDQFGKKMPVWGEFTRDQKRLVDVSLVRLNEVTLQGGEVMPEHVMKMDWLNKRLGEWISAQQAEAVRTDDRTRDIFCRRAAVVGFRAGMLAFFLWGETATPPIRRNVCDFALWVANHMLNQHLLRFNIKTTASNVNHWEGVYKDLPDEFTRGDLEKRLISEGVDTPVRMVLYKWKLLGNIEEAGTGRIGAKNKLATIKFKKVK